MNHIIAGLAWVVATRPVGGSRAVLDEPVQPARCPYSFEFSIDIHIATLENRSTVGREVLELEATFQHERYTTR